MDTKFICPFCKKPLLPVIERGVLMCFDDGFIVELKQRNARITDKAPRHLQESYQFLKEFKMSEPTMVFAKEPLYSEQFTLQDCIFIACKQESKLVKCTDITNLSTSVIKTWHLIAGQNNVADGIIQNMYNALTLSSECNPLVRTETPPAEKFLWLKLLLENSPNKVPASNIHKVVMTYFQPTLEGMLQSLIHPFEGVALERISDEQALYSLIVCKPDINIAWGSTPRDMLENIIRYVRACLNDIEDVDISTKVVPEIPDNWTTKLVDELRVAYYGHMPSTAINTSEVNDLPSFDILNHEFATGYFDGQVVNGKVTAQLLTMCKSYTVLSALWDKYCSSQMSMGIAGKRNFLRSMMKNVPSDNEEMVVYFWKEMAKYYNKEIV